MENKENNNKSFHFRQAKVHRTARVSTEENEAKSRMTSTQGLPSRNKFSKWIVMDKANAISNSKRTGEISKYINIKLTDFNKKSRFRIPQKNRRLNTVKINCESINLERSKNDITESLEIMNRQQKLGDLHAQIGLILKNLQTLKGYGFSEKKITKWMNTFLSKKNMLIQQIFLRSWINKKSLDNSILLQRFTSVQIILKRIQKLLTRISDQDIGVLLSEVKYFKNYIEQIVISKAKMNLDQIILRAPENPIVKLPLRNQFPTSPEVLTFAKDLKAMQYRYGQLHLISKLNREMFTQVLETEQKFVQYFYSSGKE